MNNVFSKISLGAVLILWIAASSGCVPLLIGAAAGAGGIAYVKGALVENIDETVEDVHQASLAALKGMNVFVTADELNRHSAVIKAEYEDGRKVDIKVDAVTEFVSKITIRVGVVGDPDESNVILRAIEQQL